MKSYVPQLSPPKTVFLSGAPRKLQDDQKATIIKMINFSLYFPVTLYTYLHPGLTGNLERPTFLIKFIVRRFTNIFFIQNILVAGGILNQKRVNSGAVIKLFAALILTKDTLFRATIAK